MSILKEIYDYKINFVSKQKERVSQKDIVNQIKLNNKKGFIFYEKLKNEENKISIIGELKKASPSLGKIVNKNIDLVKMAHLYEINNISCLSILTDEKYFCGSINDLIDIRKKSSLPILRKEFIVDEYQIYESKLHGADCILIILSMINDKDAKKFAQIAFDLEMDSIIEVHNFDELKAAKYINSKIIGINNRNLKNFVTDINISIKLAKSYKNENKILISESGFHSREDMDKIRETTSINTFLIGEYLMKSNNLQSHIQELLNN